MDKAAGLASRVRHGLPAREFRFADGRELKDAMVFNAEDLVVPEEFAQAEV